MITTRAKMAGGGAALIAGAGLTLVLLTGNAGATTPVHSPGAPHPGVVVTKSGHVGSGTITRDPNGPCPTATVTATPDPVTGQTAPAQDAGAWTVAPIPRTSIPESGGEMPTRTVFPTPVEAGTK